MKKAGDFMDIIIDTIKDTYLIIPTLLIMYLCLEYIEHKHSIEKYQDKLIKYGPLLGAILGLFPQCGFSVLASLLFIENKITLGTLISVFIATSDEAIPILIAYPQLYLSLFMILVIKFIIAIVMGYIVDIVFKNNHIKTIHPTKQHHHEYSILVESIMRTLKIYGFIFIINLILSWIIETIGDQQLSTLLFNQSLLQPILSAIFGFIPNCASSVILSQLYINQVLSFPSLLSGLITNAGLGLVALLQQKVHYQVIIKICMILFISALLLGIPLQWFHLH